MSAAEPAPEVFAAEGPRRLILPASALAGLPVPPRAWHVPDYMPASTVTLLTGDGGLGKSELATQLGVATVLGRPWMGRTPRQGPVLYLSSEDDRDELHRRAEAAAMFYGATLDQLDDLHLWPLADEEPLLAVAGGRGEVLDPTPLFGDLEWAAHDLRPAMIVLDSLADVFGGEENSRAQARQFVALLRRLAISVRAAVLVLAHPSLNGLSSGSGMSGSTAWSNSVRSRLYLTRPTGSDPDPDLRTLSLMKANYSGGVPELSLRRRIGGYEVEGGEGATRLDRVSAQAAADRTFLTLVAQYQAEGRTVSDKPGANYAPSVFAKDPRANGIGKAGLTTCMNRAFAEGRVRVQVTGPESRPLRTIVTAEGSE